MEEELYVLAVDDNLIDRKLMERILKIPSCKVTTTAENGLRSLEHLGLQDPQETSSLTITNVVKVNHIITDYCMPGMTGFELLKKLKEESSNLKEIPVVILSLENIPTCINKCLASGAQMFMQKPLKLSDVEELKCHLSKFRV